MTSVHTTNANVHYRLNAENAPGNGDNSPVDVIEKREARFVRFVTKPACQECAEQYDRARYGEPLAVMELLPRAKYETAPEGRHLCRAHMLDYLAVRPYKVMVWRGCSQLVDAGAA